MVMFWPKIKTDLWPPRREDRCCLWKNTLNVSDSVNTLRGAGIHFNHPSSSNQLIEKNLLNTKTISSSARAGIACIWVSHQLWWEWSLINTWGQANLLTFISQEGIWWLVHKINMLSIHDNKEYHLNISFILYREARYTNIFQLLRSFLDSPSLPFHDASV